jgi:aryl-alcohol dehydrogenase-like predicted oxidoreductase
MRYRPLGRSGAAVSCLTLVLTDEPMRRDDRVRLVYAALELGVNCFEVQARDPEVAAALADALASIERRMVFVALRVGWSRDRSGRRVRDLTVDGINHAIESTLDAAALNRFDVVIVEAPDDEPLPVQVIPTLEDQVEAGRVRMLGIAGEDGVDAHLGSGVFQVLATPFNIQSGWRERSRLRAAVQADMAIIGSHYMPFAPPVEEDRPSGPFGLGRLFAAKKPKVDESHAFLKRTPGWTPEEICLGYALTEPSITTIETGVHNAEHLQALADVVERDLPTGAAAQIEMARFSHGQLGGAA